MRICAYLLIAFMSLSFAESPATGNPEEAQAKPKPKWADYDAWRKKLKEGLPEGGVRNILGEPLYIEKNSGGAKWYYQYSPKIIEKTDKGSTKKIFSAPVVAVVTFRAESNLRKKPGGKPIYALYEWKEPDWVAADAGKYDVPGPKKKLKPKRKLEPYERQQTWERLRFGLNQQAVRRMLGEPTRVVEEGLKYHYNLPCKEVVLTFAGAEGTLSSWDEPCWLAIELELYEEVQEDAEAEVSTAQKQ